MTPVTDRAAIAKAHPDSWVPISKGDKIEGDVIDVRSAWSDVRNNGSNYPLLIIETAEGKQLNVHAFSTVLYNEIMRWRPVPGEHVEIVYLGAEGKPSRTGFNPPAIYRVAVAGRDLGELAGSVYDRLDEPRGAAPPTDVPAVDDELPF
jgi:hypothetical protein